MYKEKYLKYKTKYLDLKSYLSGAPNIIQEGGVVWPWTTKKPMQPVSEPVSEPVYESVYEHVIESTPTIDSAIAKLENENMMILAIPMNMDEYNIHKSNGKSRIPWSLEQKIVDRWNSVYQKIYTGEIKDIILHHIYKIHIQLDNGDSAIISMPDGGLTYTDTHYMDRNTNVIRTEVIPYFMNQITGEIQQSYGA